MSKISLTLLLVGVSLSNFCFAQASADSLKVSPTNFIEIGGLLSSSSRTPFWLQANQFGIVPRTGSALMLHAGGSKVWNLDQKDALTEWRINHSRNNTVPRWQAEVGAEVVANLGSTSRFLLPQVYGAIRYGNWELFAGRRKQWFGLADSTLGTGSYIWSGNALPLPRIQIGLKQFTAVPFTNGWLSVLGSYSEGWFENSRPITSELKLHQKQFYGKLGRPGGKLKVYAGFNHQVQYGGRSPYETLNGQMPKGFKNYVSMVLGRTGVAGPAANFDSTNRVGNHLGTIDLAFEIDSKNANWFFYRQNIFEDGSLYYLTSIADGLNGMRIRRKEVDASSSFTIKEIVVEGMYTKSQGGPSFIIDQALKRGRDNYFNNAQVRDGWSYYDRTIGTPFIPPTSETSWKFPKYADSFTSNNRVWVLHTGLGGSFLRRFDWQTKLSLSSNNGTYDQPIRTVYQFSGLLTIQTRTEWFGGNTMLRASIATDQGELYPASSAFSFSIRKEGLFNATR